MSSNVLVPSYDEIKTHLNHQLSFSPYSNRGHILIDNKHYSVEVDKDGHLFSPEKLDGYDFYDRKSYIGHYNGLKFSPSGNIQTFFKSAPDFLSKLFSRKDKYDIRNHKRYDVRNTTTCRDTNTNCTNVGGRCYYMAAMSFLAKSAYAFHEAGVVSRQFEAALDFAFKMTACSYKKQEEYCRRLPETMTEINRRYLKLRRTQYNPSQIIESGSSNLLLEAILSTVKGGVCRGYYHEDYNAFVKFLDNEYCNSHLGIFSMSISKKISNTVDVKKQIDDAIYIMKKGHDVIILGGTISVPGHAIGFNICTDSIITVCDPNLNECWIAGDTSSSIATPEYFEQYGTIESINFITIKKGRYVPYRVNDRVSVKWNYTDDTNFFQATVIRVIDEENLVLKYEGSDTLHTNLNEWEVTPISISEIVD